MATSTRVVHVSVIYTPNTAAMAHFLGWYGPIGRDFERRCQTLAYRARVTAGIDTGALRASIGIDRNPNTHNQIEARIGANPGKGGRRGYSLPHHEGARPHVIRPRRKGGYLRFMVAGRIVFARSVHHPGNLPNPYLTRWLREFVR